MMSRIGSIRTLIPLVAMLVYFSVSVLSSFNQYWLLKRQIVQEAPQTIRSTLLATQRHLEDALARRDLASIESEIFNLSVLSEIKESTLIDAKGVVVESTVISSKGREATQNIKHIDAERVQQVLTSRQPLVLPASDNEMHVYFPVMARKPHVLFVHWSLKPQINRIAGVLVYNLIMFWCVGGLLLAGLVWVLHREITLPLRRLGQNLSYFDNTQEFQTLDVPGNVREIRDLATAIQSMQKRLGESYLQQQASEKSYRRLFNMAQEGVWVIDPNGVTVMVNQSMAAMMGCTVEDMIGQSIENFMDEAGRTISRTHLENRRAGIAEQIDFEWLTRDGRRIYTVMQTAPLYDTEGCYSGAIAGIMDITQRREAEQIISQQANYDPLTHLPNRRRITELLEKEMTRAKRHNHIGAVLFIDLDHFKNINDSLGHPVGDALLVAMAERLQRHIRMEDTIARLGGDEFVVLLPELHHDPGVALTSSQAIAYKLQAAISQGFTIDNHQLNLTCSIGIAVYPQDQETIHDIIRQADTAMYRSKQDGRNLVRFFTKELQQEAERTLQLQLLLPKALEEEQFEIYFQPQLNQHQQLIGAEALLRWVHPERGFISPLYFIRAAEESGLIHPLGDWIIRKVCSELKRWQQIGLPASFERVAINISPRQFIVEDFSRRVCDLVGESGVNPSWIELEITEGMLMSNLDSNIAKMQFLKEKGFYLSIDDFGTGYSCLSYLKSLPISKLKIDQSFTRDLSSDRNDRSIVQTIILMAQTLELDVLAEGVETREQFEFLSIQGCHKYQGYYFGKPVSAQEFFQKWIMTSAQSSLQNNA